MEERPYSLYAQEKDSDRYSERAREREGEIRREIVGLSLRRLADIRRAGAARANDSPFVETRRCVCVRACKVSDKTVYLRE